MPTELSRKIHSMMAKEMGTLGKFIIKKQCTNLSIDPDEIEQKDLPALAKAISDAVIMFTGKDKSDRIRQEMRKLQD